MSERGNARESAFAASQMVVPTGFEPVFKFDYDFALILQRLRTFSLSEKGVRLKHEGLRSTLEKANSCPVYIAVSPNASSRYTIEIEAVQMGLVPLGISNAPVNLDTSPRTA